MDVKISNYERLPCDPHQLTVEHLAMLAEWQRRVDKEVRREV